MTVNGNAISCDVPGCSRQLQVTITVEQARTGTMVRDESVRLAAHTDGWTSKFNPADGTGSRAFPGEGDPSPGTAHRCPVRRRGWTNVCLKLAMAADRACLGRSCPIFRFRGQRGRNAEDPLACSHQLAGQQVGHSSSRLDSRRSFPERLSPGQQLHRLLTGGSDLELGQLLFVTTDGHSRVGRLYGTPMITVMSTSFVVG
jgi:hypothetical protein